MIKKVDEQDYSKPSTEIDYATKARKKRRRGDAVEDEYPKKKTLAPYKREHLNLLVEDEYDPIWDDLDEDPLAEEGWDFPEMTEEEIIEQARYIDGDYDNHEGCTYCDD